MKHIKEMLPLLLQEEVSEQEKQLITEHLKGCSSCRDEWESLQRQEGLLKGWQEEKAPQGLVTQTMNKIRNTDILRDRALPWAGWFGMARLTYVSAGLVLALAGVLAVIKAPWKQISGSDQDNRSYYLTALEQGSSYESYKVVAVASTEKDVVSLLNRVENGQAQVISVREVE